MSVNSEIARLKSSKSDIKNAIERRGVTVPDSEKLDRYAGYIAEIKTGEMGPPPIVKETRYRYLVGISETEKPTGEWLSVKPNVPRGQYLWTEVTIDFGPSGSSTFYSVDYKAKDGAVSNINDKTASPEGRIDLTATDVGALSDGSGAALANSYVHEYSLGDHLTPEQSEDIRSGRFQLVRVGGYWTINGHKYWAAHADYRLNTGEKKLYTHHMLVVPDKTIGAKCMNASRTTTGGYASSKMKTTNLAEALRTIEQDFGSFHVLPYSISLTNAVMNDHSSGSAWYTNQKIDLMNECMVYGFFSWGNGFDMGCDKTQLAIFKARPDLIVLDGSYWLRDVKSDHYFSVVKITGESYFYGAEIELGIRPAFLVY